MTPGHEAHQDGYIKWIRSHVGHELIYLVYATAFVFDEQGHLLVQERYDFDWLSVPGGALEMDESLRECAVRETYEETGVTCEVERLIGVYSHPQYNLLYPNGDLVQPWTAAFVCRATNDTIATDGRETLRAAFQPPAAIRHRLPLQYQDMLHDAQNSESNAAFEAVHYEAECRPYYPILRARVGHARVILPGGTAAIFNNAGELLAVHDKKRDLWDLPAGLADLGETTTGTVVREVREETGLIVEPVRTLGIYSAPHLTHSELCNGDQAHWVDLLLECQIIGGNARPDEVEVDGLRYMTIEALAAQPHITPIRRQMYDDLRWRELAPFIR
ncbi:MAG: NUDIX domain-containing protein [Chloroflexi bacterium]|nr:NUDIX domain-containing protein [Chloroflexota bacterium]